MEIMDHFAYELLSQPLPPGFDEFGGPLSCSGGYAYGDDIAVDMEQLDNYFRAIGVLPPLPPTTDAHVHVHPSLPSSSHDDDDTTTTAALATYDSDDDDFFGARLRAMETDARHWPPSLSSVPVAARTALVQWMHHFAGHFGLAPDALHRAVSYADRFLSLSPRPAADDYQLRLLGAAAVYVASKYEDSSTAAWRMNASDIAACCGFASSADVLDAERDLLAALGFRLGGPTARTFVDHFTRRRDRHGQEEDQVRRSLAHAIADSSLLDHRCCVGILPSAVAAATVLLSWMCLQPAHGREQVSRWSRELDEVTGYRAIDVYDGVECLYNMLPGDPGFHISPLLFADPSELS